ncbi:MAG: DinB family protein [Thermomicrobiales bacterium]
MDPVVETVVGNLEQLRQDIHAGLAGQSAAALNWRPYPGGNTIAGLLAHMIESSTFLLATGRGETIERHRDEQFAATSPDAATLLAQVDAAWAALQARVQTYTPADFAAQYSMRGTPRTGAWFLLHIGEHMLEHWGQIQLTRDLYAQQAG